MHKASITSHDHCSNVQCTTTVTSVCMCAMQLKWERTLIPERDCTEFTCAASYSYMLVCYLKHDIPHHDDE